MTPWDNFFKEKITKIFQEKKCIVDIGGGLRISKEKGDRYDRNREWILPFLSKVNYRIMDYVDSYKPDVVGDVHHLPFPENSIEAILCIAVLEHIENPFVACDEIYKALKPGCYCFIYTPFIYNYHSEGAYYKDYWRYSADAVDLLFKRFSSVEKQNVRGALATWLYISPLGKIKFLAWIFTILDRIFNKMNSRQTSGYHIFLIK